MVTMTTGLNYRVFTIPIIIQSYSANNMGGSSSGDTPKIDALHGKIVLKWMV